MTPASTPRLLIAGALLAATPLLGCATPTTDTPPASNTTPAQDPQGDRGRDDVPAEHKAALKQADTYANTMHMSKQGVYDQLVSEHGGKFPADAAQYAVDNVQADWRKNAVEKAKTYQQMGMSNDAIRDQLASEHGEKFTEDEADYGVEHLGS